VDVVLGWPEIVVDALDERLDWLGWSSTSQDITELKAVYRDNRLAHEFNKAKIDALVTGVGFLEVSQGGEGEPEVIINAVSSQHATYIWDDRAERVEVGLVEKYGDRKSTRLNSSHVSISYAVFCLKKKNALR